MNNTTITIKTCILKISWIMLNMNKANSITPNNIINMNLPLMIKIILDVKPTPSSINCPQIITKINNITPSLNSMKNNKTILLLSGKNNKVNTIQVPGHHKLLIPSLSEVSTIK